MRVCWPRSAVQDRRSGRGEPREVRGGVSRRKAPPPTALAALGARVRAAAPRPGAAGVHPSDASAGAQRHLARARALARLLAPRQALLGAEASARAQRSAVAAPAAAAETVHPGTSGQARSCGLCAATAAKHVDWPRAVGAGWRYDNTKS